MCLLAGWIWAVPQNSDATVQGRRGVMVSEPLEIDDIDRYVLAIHATDLFPNARLRDELQAENMGTDTAEGLAQALTDPSLSALVKREDVWRIHLYAGFEGVHVREVNDQLSDGWTIQTIEPTAVLLEKDGEVRRIDVFEAESTEP